MADDIDIEEHDVLDNPQIKNMFPDIAQIKTEVFDEADEFPYEDYADYNASAPIKLEPLHDEFLDFKPTSNKIILGSKPTSTPVPETKIDRSSENLNAYVLVEDLGSMIYSSPCYCKECQTLFPTVNTLDAHKMVAHSYLTVAPPVNKAVKSTSKSSVNTNTSGLLICNHCNNKFPDNTSLITHLYMVMDQPKSLDGSTKNVIKIGTKIKAEPVNIVGLKIKKENVKIEANANENLQTKTCFKCTVCTSYRSSESDLVNHMHSNHRVKLVSAKTSNFNGKCMFCSYYGPDIQSYNFHLSSKHPNIFGAFMKSGKLVNYKCLLCNNLFGTEKSLYRHKADSHPGMRKYQHSAKKILIDIKTLSHSKKNATTINSLATLSKNKNIATVNETSPTLSTSKNVAIMNTEAKLPQNTEVKSTVQQNKRVKQVPLSYIFKCHHCKLHFLSSFSALQHVHRCPSISEESRIQSTTRCLKCPRMFRTNDLPLHEFQHKMTSTCKVMTITGASSVRSLLYKCGVCNIHIDSYNLCKHMDLCDRVPRAESCRHCKLLIHVTCYRTHLRHHTEGKLTVMQVIKLIPYDSNAKAPADINPIAIKRKASSDEEPDAKKMRRTLDKTSDKIIARYCYNCACVTFRRNKKHASGKCSTLAKKICDVCGLNYQARSRHVRLHKSFGFGFKDYKIVDADENVITERMSGFPRCQSCGVCFGTKSQFARHKCKQFKAKVCHICNERFDADCFGLHYEFHKLSLFSKKDDHCAKESPELPDLLEKYEAMQAIWNILYKCTVCNTVTDSYDVAVEHSQAHFSKMESFGVILQSCDICKLAFKMDCFKKHKELHARTQLNLDSFRIMEFDYVQLHSATWFQLFSSLEPKIVNLILSKSMYKHTRSVRMRVYQDGDSEDTLYLCAKCNHLIDPKDIKTHALIKNSCSNFGKKCDECDYEFASVNLYNQHCQSKPHPDMTSIRILMFNREEDQDILEDMRESAKDEVSVAPATETSKSAKAATYKIKIKGKANIPVDIGPRKMFYRCTRCNLSVISRKSAFRHNCSRWTKAKCPYCNIVVIARIYDWHINSHRKGNIGYIGPKLYTVDFTPGYNSKPAVIKKNITVKPIKPMKDDRSDQQMNENTAESPEGTGEDPLQANKVQKIDKITIKLFNKEKHKSVVLYRCQHCDVCFLSFHTLKSHYQKTKLRRGKKCVQCGFNFPTRTLIKHLAVHHKTKEHFIVKDGSRKHPKDSYFISDHKVDNHIEDVADCAATENSNVSENLKTDYAEYSKCSEKKTRLLIAKRTNILYKCLLCPALTPNRQNYQDHLIRHEKQEKKEYRVCKICGLECLNSFYSRHIGIHAYADVTISDFTIRKNVIGRCNQCKVFFPNIISLKKHIKDKVNLDPDAAKICSVCGLNIFGENYANHMEWFHEKSCVKLKDMYVLEADHEEDIDGPDDTLTDDVEDTTSNLEFSKTESFAKDENNFLFKCIECSLHLISIDTHSHIDKKFDKGEQCSVCDLNILKTDLASHTEMHHRKRKLEKNSIVIKAFIPLYKCAKCPLYSHRYENISHHLMNHNQRSTKKMVSKTCEDCNYTFSNTDYRQHVLDYHKKTDLKGVNFHVISCPVSEEGCDEKSQSDDRVLESPINDSLNDESESKPPSPNTKKYKVKLYKCAACNVCFLSQGVCYKHVQKHTVMDAREYVECKICTLQFSIMILHKHMKKHHIDNNFTLEEVLIEEYQPDPEGGAPKIELYYAVDRVQSELVSTTSDVTTGDKAI